MSSEMPVNMLYVYYIGIYLDLPPDKNGTMRGKSI
jgi:hypothetical protein